MSLVILAYHTGSVSEREVFILQRVFLSWKSTTFSVSILCRLSVLVICLKQEKIDLVWILVLQKGELFIKHAAACLVGSQ